jgi:hypothetical protein
VARWSPKRSGTVFFLRFMVQSMLPHQQIKKTFLKTSQNSLSSAKKSAVSKECVHFFFSFQLSSVDGWCVLVFGPCVDGCCFGACGSTACRMSSRALLPPLSRATVAQVTDLTVRRARSTVRLLIVSLPQYRAGQWAAGTKQQRAPDPAKN